MTDIIQMAEEAGFSSGLSMLTNQAIYIANAEQLKRLEELVRADERERIHAAAGPMANVCYNLAQSQQIPQEHRDIMRSVCKDYDEAIRARGEG